MASVQGCPLTAKEPAPLHSSTFDTAPPLTLEGQPRGKGEQVQLCPWLPTPFTAQEQSSSHITLQRILGQPLAEGHPSCLLISWLFVTVHTPKHTGLHESRGCPRGSEARCCHSQSSLVSPASCPSPPHSSTDVHTVASLLKLYLRELPEPVIPFARYEDFLSCAQLLTKDEGEVSGSWGPFLGGGLLGGGCVKSGNTLTFHDFLWHTDSGCSLPSAL